MSASGGYRLDRAERTDRPVPYQRHAAPDGPVTAAAATAPTTVGEQAARAGWTPAPRPSPAHTPPRGQQIPRAARAARTGDGRALTVLRTVTYVLVSLASLLFILLVVYGGIEFYRLSTEFPRLLTPGT
ncbi:hypothetical protein GCM10009836_10220 [Pseudonocardia ailaonensis]|uniref:Uncharacterized protein n=1 Tax=Pseudonocardia ailaonensis TaxID=367279 RepID=A0ABN2MPX9_9PSEU